MNLQVLYAVAVMGGLGVVFGCLLAFASKKFAVQTDPRISAIRAVLPGANCGGCGFPGCDGYAAACVNEGCPTNRCAAGGPAVAERIAAIMGVDAAAAEPMVAFVRCRGENGKSGKNCVYLGYSDCQAASVVPGRGPEACSFGCMGFGTCVKACSFDAIHVENGLARVDRDKCTGCGACAAACPRGVIGLIPKSARVAVACSNPLPGAVARKVCTAACIGCSMCVKVCLDGAISMKGAVAVVDPAKCAGCSTAPCTTKCPTKAIVTL